MILLEKWAENNKCFMKGAETKCIDMNLAISDLALVNKVNKSSV